MDYLRSLCQQAQEIFQATEIVEIVRELLSSVVLPIWYVLVVDWRLDRVVRFGWAKSLIFEVQEAVPVLTELWHVLLEQ